MTNSTLHLLYPKVCWEVLTSHLSVTNYVQKSENKHLFWNINQTDHQKLLKKTNEPPPENLNAWVFFTSSPFFGSQKVTPIHPCWFIGPLAWLQLFLQLLTAVQPWMMDSWPWYLEPVFFEKTHGFPNRNMQRKHVSTGGKSCITQMSNQKKHAKKTHKWNDLEMIRPVLGKLSY